MDDSNSEEDIHRALALMHSKEKNSGEKLRMLLDSFIAKKFGPEKTLTSRMSKSFLKKMETCQQIPEVSSEFLTSDEMQNFSSETIMNKKSIKLIKNFTTESYDSMDKDEVPRISIPDEGSEIEALCLVCNESNLGPFILLECQICRSVYHPLCHQPPLVEIEIYDLQSTWFCGKCTENSNHKESNLKTYSKKDRIQGKTKTSIN